MLFIFFSAGDDTVFILKMKCHEMVKTTNLMTFLAIMPHLACFFVFEKSPLRGHKPPRDHQGAHSIQATSCSFQLYFGGWHHIARAAKIKNCFTPAASSAGHRSCTQTPARDKSSNRQSPCRWRAPARQQTSVAPGLTASTRSGKSCRVTGVSERTGCRCARLSEPVRVAQSRQPHHQDAQD